MVASDTVVGIVGSVLLVAVMVGVFVYEYNNAPAQGGDPFLAAFPGLDPKGDLDNDGKANSEDDDLDGDGVKNTAPDNEVAYKMDFQGDSGLPGDDAVLGNHAFKVDRNGIKLQATVTYTSAVPSPLPTIPGLRAVLVKDGQDVETLESSTSGGAVTFSVDLPQPGSGNWAIRVEQTSPGPVTPYSGSVTVTYNPSKLPAEPVK